MVPRHGGELAEREPGGCGGVVPPTNLARYRGEQVGDRDQVRSRISTGCRVHPHQTLYPGAYPGLLEHLPAHRRLRALADLHESTGQRPSSLKRRAAPPDEEDASAVQDNPVDDQGRGDQRRSSLVGRIRVRNRLSPNGGRRPGSGGRASRHGLGNRSPPKGLVAAAFAHSGRARMLSASRSAAPGQTPK